MIQYYYLIYFNILIWFISPSAILVIIKTNFLVYNTVEGKKLVICNFFVMTQLKKMHLSYIVTQYSKVYLRFCRYYN